MNNEQAQRPDPANDIFAIRRPDWDQWKSIRATRLWKAVALLCNIDPVHVAFSFDHAQLSPPVLKRHPAYFTDTLNLAKSHLGLAQLKPLSRDPAALENSEIDLITFASWANFLGIALPKEFPWQPEMQLEISGWPWGTHSTKLLEKLASAADRFWKNYDPSDYTTAPTNDEVIGWLVDQDVSEKMAKAIATILRADGLRTGPRK